MALPAARREERQRERGRQSVVWQAERRQRGEPEHADDPDRQRHPGDLVGVAPRPPPYERPDRDAGGERPRRRAQDRDGEEVHRGQRHVLVGKVAGSRHVQDVVVDRRVPAEPGRAQLHADPPAETDDQAPEHPRPRQPLAEGARPSGQDERQADRQRRQHGAQRVLGQRGDPEDGEAADTEAAPALADSYQAQGESAGERRHEQCLRSDVATEREEAHTRQQRQTRHDAAGAVEQPRAEPRGGPDGGERGHGRDGARHRFARAHRREAEGGQHVEERRLVDVADAVQRQRQRIAGRRQLARDLRVHPLARVVERRGAETAEEERGGGERRQRRGEERRRPLFIAAFRARQVRETRKTPATIKRIPAQRVGVTASASSNRATNATTM